MAEALFEDGDEHPIELYLREASELVDDGALIPGGLHSFSHDRDPFQTDSPAARLVQSALKLIQPLMTVHTPSNATAQRELAERLKYLVISSSLLSTSLATHHSPRRGSGWRTPSLPSMAFTQLDGQQPLEHRPWSPLQLAVAAVTPVVLMAGHFTLGFFLALVFGIMYSISRAQDMVTHHAQRPSHLVQTIASVEALIAAGAFWDTVVTEGFSVLDREERSIASSPTAVDSQVSLRVALMSTLNTTDTQCDNIRNLFVPLTSPTALSQLSEMYAPPATKPSVLSRPLSPELSRRLSYNHLANNGRPHTLRLSISRSHESLSHIRGQSASATMGRANRASWYGPQSSSAPYLSGLSGTATMPHSPLSKREKRRSALPALFIGSRPWKGGSPISPARHDALEQAESSSLPSFSPGGEDQFSTPPSLARRNSARAGLTFNSHRFMNDSISEHPNGHIPLTPVSAPRSPVSRPMNPAPSTPSPSSSRFTTMPRSTPTGSSAALRQTLEATLASRRYAVAHLLALRFEEEPEQEEDDFVLIPEERDDEAYWEDVRSVVDLLATALEEATARMVEALEESEHDAALVSQPSPVRNGLDLPPPSASFADRLLFPPGLHPTPGDSFAPGPSNLARLAGHMDSIVESMGNVKENLSELADAIRAYQLAQLAGDDSPDASDPRANELRSQTLTCYERLRRELGIALRECERSRAPLQSALWPPATVSRRSFDDAPELTASEGSASSCDSGLSHDSPEPPRPHVLLASPELELPGLARDDDASAHLLRDTSAAHLPAPGIEQVFEASSGSPGSAAPLRERSKLSRTERIELAKAKREENSTKRQSLIAALGFNFEEMQEQMLDKEARDTWGPGTAVVDELKDAIWRVGERRRRLVEGHSPAADPHGPMQILDQHAPALEPLL
ncbi:hypothetical protein EXIGLDRAFT_722919 [Exidia glandulosa HHB12029]|uniref:Uncharacterized protein n=1 Tax=Exidia glandulosa HHB12029 TaxID=1314781 RepID=A0A165F2C1_EXIGL|nr:hypothetical protein EXIGLDRAFT_722919 [Exidia glandulosa HHB12029]